MSLLLDTPALSLIGAIGAALSTGTVEAGTAKHFAGYPGRYGNPNWEPGIVGWAQRHPEMRHRYREFLETTLDRL